MNVAAGVPGLACCPITSVVVTRVKESTPVVNDGSDWLKQIVSTPSAGLQAFCAAVLPSGANTVGASEVPLTPRGL